MIIGFTDLAATEDVLGYVQIPLNFGSALEYAVTYGVQNDFNNTPLRAYANFFNAAGDLANVHM